MSVQELLYWLVKAFRLLVFISCIGTLTWQLSKCFLRYLEKPQGTQISFISSAGKMIPSITVCPPNIRYNISFLNSTILSECGLNLTEYHHQSKWSVQGIEKCADPKIIFHSIIIKPEHLIRHFRIDARTHEDQMIFSNDTAYILPVDMIHYGRCYTFNLPSRTQRDGVSKIILTLVPTARVFVHNKGVLSMDADARSQFADVGSYKKYYFNVEHNNYKMLDLDGKLCEDEQDYSLDECVHNSLNKESMEKIGCVSPFGINKDNICKDPKRSKMAFELFWEYRNYGRSNLTCLKPCSFLNIKLSKSNENPSEKKDGRLIFFFREFIQETSSYYSYGSRELIAEIGGYVGLFIGVSIYQVADLFENIIRKLKSNIVQA